MAPVSTVSAEASQPNIPLSVIFMTSSAILMNEMHERMEAPFLGHTGHTSDAKVLVAELRPGHCKYSVQYFATRPSPRRS